MSSFRRRRQMRDEGFDQFATGALESFSAAEVGGISLNESRIEVVLADQKAELVAESGLAVARTVGRGMSIDVAGGAEALGALENAPNSSTEQRPIPYALRKARLTARVSATRNSAPRTTLETFVGSASPNPTKPLELPLL